MGPSSEVAILSLEGQWKRWVKRYTWHLDQLPALFERMRSDVVRISSDAARYGAERVDSSRDGAPVPFRVEVVDAIDDLWAALVQYAEDVAERLGEQLPEVARWRVRSEAAGARVGADVRADSYTVISWLIERVEEIVAHSALDSTEDHLFGLIRSGVKQFLTPQPERGRQCRVCGAGRVTVRWSKGGEVSHCDRCYDTVRLEVVRPLSEACADQEHVRCESVWCLCGCHERTTSLISRAKRTEPTAIAPLPPTLADCDHSEAPWYLGDDELRHCGECGAAL